MDAADDQGRPCRVPSVQHLRAREHDQKKTYPEQGRRHPGRPSASLPVGEVVLHRAGRPGFVRLYTMECKRACNQIQRKPAMVHGESPLRVADIAKFVLGAFLPLPQQCVFVNRQTEIFVRRITFLQDRECVDRRLGLIYTQRLSVQVQQAKSETCHGHQKNESEFQRLAPFAQGPALWLEYCRRHLGSLSGAATVPDRELPLIGGEKAAKKDVHQTGRDEPGECKQCADARDEYSAAAVVDTSQNTPCDRLRGDYPS